MGGGGGGGGGGTETINQIMRKKVASSGSYNPRTTVRSLQNFQTGQFSSS